MAPLDVLWPPGPARAPGRELNLKRNGRSLSLLLVEQLQVHCFDAVTVSGSLLMRVPLMSGLSSQNDPTDTSTLNLINFHDVEND